MSSCSIPPTTWTSWMSSHNDSRSTRRRSGQRPKRPWRLRIESWR